ncbi:AraC family transcriptional regulator [Sessilibacter corallicola]|uniref:AraC family transcriptional regulator n=1 Tax=Sessilibacter corallicola TaxID=2904075 RepID=A0ABQ0A942_9GAMM
MNTQYQQDLLRLIDTYTENDGNNETQIPNLTLFKSTTTHISLPTVYTPSLCLIIQGEKDVVLGKELFHYGPSHFLIASVDLPIIGKVTQASEDKPYYAVKINIEPKKISELILQSDQLSVQSNFSERGLFIGKFNDAITESILRLVRLLQSPEDIPILADAMIREIYYRILKSEYGNLFSQVAIKGSHIQRISVAIQKLKQDFQQTITIEELANLAEMSISSFHSHFKSITNMSPLQYQKSIRLTQARHLMLTQKADVNSAAYKVGYESPSQFSREYSRMFGNPPGRDINRLMNQ